MTNILNMFDTVKLSEDGSWLHLVSPGDKEKVFADGEKKKKPLRIKLKGPDSDAWTCYVRKNTKNIGSDKEKSKQKSIADTNLDEATIAAKLTIGFDNIPNGSGDDLQFSFESALKLYLDYKDIRMQVVGFMTRQVNFTRKLSKD